MSEESSAVDRHDWQDYLPWLIIFRSLRPAVSLRLLVLSAIGLVGMVAGWRICWDVLAYTTDQDGVQVVVDDPVMKSISAGYSDGVPPWPWQPAYADFGTSGPLDVVHSIPYVGGLMREATATISQLTMPFQLLFRQDLGYRSLAYALLCCAWALVIWGFFGAVITRTVALKLTRDEGVSWTRASQFSRARIGSYISAPVLPILGVLLVAIPLALLGLLAKLDVGVLVAGVLWPLAILAGLIMTVLLVGLLFGWPLMWATISTEGTDAFDALSRAYAYVFQRPFHYLFYSIVASIVGLLGLTLVRGVATMVIHCTRWGASWGAGGNRINDMVGTNSPWVTDIGTVTLTDGVGGAGAALIQFWENVVFTLVTAFAISFIWSASTSIYLLLRRQVDAVELDEIFLEEEEERFGLPVMEDVEPGAVADADSDTPNTTAGDSNGDSNGDSE